MEKNKEKKKKAPSMKWLEWLDKHLKPHKLYHKFNGTIQYGDHLDFPTDIVTTSTKHRIFRIGWLFFDYDIAYITVEPKSCIVTNASTPFNLKYGKLEIEVVDEKYKPVMDELIKDANMDWC
jgi:hypothetical protein